MNADYVTPREAEGKVACLSHNCADGGGVR